MQTYYTPIPKTLEYIEEKYGNCEKVLEIGPGHIPLKFATHFIDHIYDYPNTVKIDLDTTPIPFSDKFFDFVYCRHVLEDIQNPDFAFQELTRVAKSGYIETPSPIAELTRDVCGEGRGYIHHRYIVWNDGETLNFVAKYPIVEFIKEYDGKESLQNPLLWNTYYEWDEDTTPKCKVWKHDIHFDVGKNYSDVLNQAIKQSTDHSGKFLQ